MTAPPAVTRRSQVRASDFERVRLCGEGGSGLVYLVKLKNTAMYFALKVRLKERPPLPSGLRRKAAVLVIATPYGMGCGGLPTWKRLVSFGSLAGDPDFSSGARDVPVPPCCMQHHRLGVL